MTLPLLTFILLAVLLVVSVTFPNRRGVYHAPRFVPVRLFVKWLVLTNSVRQDAHTAAWCARLTLRYVRRRWFEQRNR